MKSLFIALAMFAFCNLSYGQNPVVDTHPGSQIYVIDNQSGQETPVATDLAVLFKNSLIDFVQSTYRARMVESRVAPEYNNRVFTITQMGVETNINGYQIVLEHWAQDPSQNVNIYTFVYHVDDNTLYFYDPRTQSWLLERIMPNNVFNLRRAAMYAQKFNVELANQPQNGQVAIDASVDLNQPVDADVAANTPPPAMPDYEQPECPSDGYLWQPGYWAYAPGRSDYYWVPGAWVAPPTAGVLWTPPYWGYEGNRYVFHIGYWGDHIGFYGGINYGYGYGGHGYYGGEWHEGHFRYNTAVVRVNTTVVHNTYINKTVINNVTINNHNSFNGGRGGVDARPTSEEISATHEHHYQPTAEQNGNQLAARGNPQQFTKGNPGGKPANLATPKVTPFHPQNNSGNRGGNPGIGGKPNQTQGTTPGRPNGQGNNPGKPNGLSGGNPDKPNVQGNTQGKPTGQPANPNGQANNPAKPNGLAGNPDKPNVQGNTPGKPTGQPANPNGQANNPAKPNGLSGNPGQGNNPVKPISQPANPPKQNGQGNNPAKPNGLPGNPNGQGTPGKPIAQPANPPKLNGPGNTPAKPTGLPANPANPGKPVKPAKTKPKPKDQPVQPANQPAKQ
jgi:hypothetical protein